MNKATPKLFERFKNPEDLAKARLGEIQKYIKVLGSNIPVPKAVMSEAAQLGKPAINQIHSDGQLKKDEAARMKALAPGYRQ